jgi:hypothetical protein
MSDTDELRRRIEASCLCGMKKSAKVSCPVLAVVVVVVGLDMF